MRKVELQDLTSTLEPGYAAIPIQASEPPPPLNLCVIVRSAPDPISGEFVLLRRFPKADVYLGCVADYSGRPVEWVEIWVQNCAPGANIHPAYRKLLSNSALEKQWRELAAALRELDPNNYFSSAAEFEASRPAWIDKAQGIPIHPKDAATGRHWELCRDDSALTHAGLPPYSSSLSRYLHLADAQAGDRFIPVTPGAPTNAHTIDLAQALPELGRLPAFNLCGAPLLFRRFAPLGLEEFSDVLSGKAWHGIENARKAFRPGGIYRLLEDEDLLRCGSTHLFTASSGQSGRYAETLHLKLQLVLQACRLAREAIQKVQLPFLNLSAESFRVSLGAVGFSLPVLWTNKLSLGAPSVAFPLPISQSKERYFQTAEPLAASIYRPAELAVPKSGVGSVRIRKATPTGEGLVLEGTLTAHERIGVDESELIWIQLPVPEGTADLYGFRDTTQAMAAGEAIFRTIPLELSTAIAASLQSVVGVPFSHVPFSILPPLSSPCDLYSLGVLAARILLVDPRNALPEALDSLLSLARQTAASYDPAVPIGERVAKIVESDPRWLETLGPQHLRPEEAAARDAFAGIPEKLWWDLLAHLIRFFPGAGPDSFCKGFADAPPLALHSIFDQPIEGLEAINIRSRALIALEWRQNLEIASLIASAEAQYN